MSTVAAPPRSDEVRATVPRRRRRWPIVLAVFLTVILVSGLIAWQVVGRTYEPLSSALFGAGGVPRHGRYLIYKDGARFRARFDVFNGGRWPVEITGVRFHPSEDFPTRQIGVEMSPRIDRCCGRLVPFEPFRLGPDQYRLIVVRFRFVGCGVGGRWDRWGLGDPVMTFRFLGLERRITFGLRDQVEFSGPPIGCGR
jgi:hypothetical protein